jgi:hypothetical protein
MNWEQAMRNVELVRQTFATWEKATRDYHEAILAHAQGARPRSFEEFGKLLLEIDRTRAAYREAVAPFIGLGPGV